MSPTLAEQALDIWLIQDVITDSFRFRDFRNCVLVSKAWNRIFTPALWKVVQFGRDERQLHETYLLNSNSALLGRYSHLVQEITLQSYSAWPAVGGSRSEVIVAEKDACESDTGEIIQGWTHEDSATLLDTVPAFPDLRVLKWWPLLSRGEETQNLYMRTMDMIQFMELHTTLENIWLDRLVLNESVFERLCQVIENHSGLKRVSITDHWIYSTEQIQRFIWACRRLDSNNFVVGGGGRINSYRTFDLSKTGCTVCLNLNPDQPLLQGRSLDQKPTLEFTRIRSLCIGRISQQSISALLPVFKMCSMLEKLELETEYPGMMITTLRDVLHEACPNLSYLKLKKISSHHPPMNWALDLLCPTTVPPNDHHHDCGGFRLRSFYLQDLFVIPARLTDIPRPWGALTGHHAPTMVELDLSSVAMPLPEFVEIASQILGLRLLKGWTVWTTTSSDTLSALANIKQIKDVIGSRQDPAIFESVVYDVGLKPWTCRGLTELDIAIYMETRDAMIEMQPSDLLMREYIVQEISQLQQLQKLSFQTDARWCPILTLPVQPYQDKYDGVSFYYGHSFGWMNRGCLDRFSKLRLLRELKWLQHDYLWLSVQDAEWMLQHWPRLYTFHARNQQSTLPTKKENRAGFELLEARKPGIGGTFFFESS